MREVRCSRIEISDKLWQIGMSEQLSNRHHLTHMKPIAIDEAHHQRASRALILLVGDLKHLCRQGIEKKISHLRDRLPCLPHLGKFRGAGWLIVAIKLIKVGARRLPLHRGQPEILLGTGQVAKSPTDTVQRQKTVTRIDFAESGKRTREFAPRKA